MDLLARHDQLPNGKWIGLVCVEYTNPTNLNRKDVVIVELQEFATKKEAERWSRQRFQNITEEEAFKAVEEAQSGKMKFSADPGFKEPLYLLPDKLH